MNEHALAFTQDRALKEIGPHREECLGDCGRVDAVEPGRNRKALRLGDGAYPAYPPPADQRADAIARLPTPDLRADALLVPATSSPGTSEAPGGGAYLPRRCMMSGRLTPAASTWTRTSDGPTSGNGRSSSLSTPGLPGEEIAMQRIRLLYTEGERVPGQLSALGCQLSAGSCLARELAAES